MKNGENVRNWRKGLGYSQRDLAETLNQKINEDIPVEDPRHYIIYQPDINKVENDTASRFVFEKVVNAIYRYMEVEQGCFGEYQDKPTKAVGLVEGAQNTYLYEGIQLRDRIIQCYEQNMKLIEEKEELSRRASELETALERSQERVAELERLLGAGMVEH